MFALIRRLLKNIKRSGAKSGLADAPDRVRALDIAAQANKVQPLRVDPKAFADAYLKALVARAEALEAMLEDKARRHGGKWFYSKVSGVSFRNHRGRSRQKIIADLQPGEELYLERDPANRHDPNAVRVETVTGEQVGFLTAHVAADAARLIDRGEIWECFVSEITGGGDQTQGVNIALVHWMPEK